MNLFTLNVTQNSLIFISFFNISFPSILIIYYIFEGLAIIFAVGNEVSTNGDYVRLLYDCKFFLSVILILTSFLSSRSSAFNYRIELSCF